MTPRIPAAGDFLRVLLDRWPRAHSLDPNTAPHVQVAVRVEGDGPGFTVTLFDELIGCDGDPTQCGNVAATVRHLFPHDAEVWIVGENAAFGKRLEPHMTAADIMNDWEPFDLL